MKLLNIKKIISCLLVGVSICLTGCSSFNNKDKNNDYILITDENRDTVKYQEAKTWEYTPAVTYSYGNLGKDVMPIIGMWGPWDIDVVYGGKRIPNLSTDEMYSQIAETGVNVLWQGNQDYSNHPQQVINALDYCAKYNMVYTVSDRDIVTWGVRSDENGFVREDRSIVHMSQEELTERLKEYALHKGFGGLAMVDEPNPYIAPTFEKVCNMYYKALEELNAPYAPAWWNAFPTGYLVRNFSYDYKKHLGEFGSAAGVVCWDMYPFEWGQVDDFNLAFYTNMNYVYDVANEKNIPWQAYVATGGNWTGIWDDHSGVKPATIEQLVWQVNTIIAYGAKGIQYFTVNQPISNLSDFETGGEHGMFDSFGNKTKYYYAAKIVNSQIHACERVLMNATQHGVISTGYIMGNGLSSSFKNLISERKFRELVSVSENSPSFIGCFDCYGKTMLYVVNSSYYDDAEVTLGFDDTYRYEVTQRAETAEIAGTKFTLKLSPGESAMVLLK